jgi:hypothetical protein
MTYTEHIRQGFRLVNRNWQLIIIQIAAVFLNLLALFVLVGVPIIVLAVVLGIEADRAGDLANLFDLASPWAMMTKYIGALLVLLVCLLLYITAALVLWLFVAGGSAGTLGKAASDRGKRFSMGEFWSEAKRLFWPLAWYYTILSLAFILLAAVLAAGVAVAAMGFDAAGLEDSRLGIFFKVMGILLIGSCGVFFLVCFYMISIQGLAPLVLEGKSAVGALKRAWGFLDEDRKGLYLLLIVVGGFIGIQIGIAVFGGLLQAIPLVGFIIYLPFSLAANIFSIYLGLAVTASVLYYYADPLGIQAAATSEGSIPESHTYQAQASGRAHSPLPPEGQSPPQGPGSQKYPPL